MPSLAGPDDRKHFNFNAQKMSSVTKKTHYFWNLIDAKTSFSILKHVANRVSRSRALNSANGCFTSTHRIITLLHTLMTRI